ncbi:FecR family protein [Pontibacter sp. HJ8]
MQFKDFSLDELAADETFQDWVLSHRPDDSYWYRWVSASDDNKEKAQLAEDVIMSLRFSEERITDDQVVDAYEQLLDRQQHLRSHSKSMSSYSWSGWQQIAAAVAFLLVACAGLYLLVKKPGMTVYATKAGENKTLVLPDGTEVLLNANSSLSLAPEWAKQPNREVWLTGEAFFSVRKNGKKFKVHTDDLEVEVLGTKFNVLTLKEKTTVVLHSGKVRLHLDDELPEVMMKPGDLVEYNEKEKKVQAKTVDTDLYTSWRDGKLNLKSTPASEVAAFIEDRYDLQITFADSALADHKLNGTLQANNEVLLLQVLAKSLDAHYSRENDRITIYQTK